jgi:hypothetical protein
MSTDRGLVLATISEVERRFECGAWDDLDLRLLLTLAREAAYSASPLNEADVAVAAYALARNLRKVRTEFRLRLVERGL